MSEVGADNSAEISANDVSGPLHVLTIDVCPCSGNAMYRTVGGRVVLSAVGRAFKKDMAEVLGGATVPRVDGQVAVHIEFHFRTRHRRDLDNYAKSVLDSLKGVAFGDDSDIFDLRLTKNIGAERDFIRVEYCAM